MVQELAVQAPAFMAALKVVINYIHGGPIDDGHNSKRQRRSLLHIASIRERVNSVQRNFLKESVCPIYDTVIFPPVDTNRVLQSQEDALVLTLRVGRFDVRRVLVYPGSSPDLLQMSGYKQMNHSIFVLENLEHLLSGFNRATMTSLGDIVLPVQVG